MLIDDVTATAVPSGPYTTTLLAPASSGSANTRGTGGQKLNMAVPHTFSFIDNFNVNTYAIAHCALLNTLSR